MPNTNTSRADSQRRTLPGLSYNLYLDTLEQKGQLYDLSPHAHLMLRYLGSRASERYGNEVAWPTQTTAGTSLRTGTPRCAGGDL